MRKWLICALALMLAATAALAEPAILTVNGSGAVYVDADRVTINVGVRESAGDVMSAQAAVNAKIDAVIAALTDMGVDPKDIYTDSISIYPEYDYSYSGDEKLTGYSAYNMIAATTAGTENAGAYIDAAFAAGANQLNGVDFFASDTTEAQHRALAMAVQNAGEKAEVLAQAAGLPLAGIRSISEGGGFYTEPVYYARASVEDAGAGTQVYANKLSVTASVSVTYALGEE